MPKSRTSTVATRNISSGGGTGIGLGNGVNLGEAVNEIATILDEQEMIDRLQDRLNEITTVSVNMPSRTRGRDEELRVTFNPDTQGIASVESASGATYEVNYNDDTCDCMHHRMRGERCRHIDAVHEALGQIMGRESGVGRTVSSEDMNNIISSQQRSDRQAEVNRMALSGIQEDDGFFYSDNIRDFENTMSRLKREPLPYEYENVLNGSNVSFGIELEFVDGDSDAIARELYREGICGVPEMVRYHAYGVPGKWKLERDGSVTSGRRGGELVSPVLTDTPETWRTLEKICEVAKRHGGRINYKCGGHVHVGMDPLDTARQRWRRFFKTISGNEEVIYRFSGGTEGRIRSNYSGYAPPFEQRARAGATMRFSMDSIEDVNALASRVSNNNRYYGINLTNISSPDKPNTVEFRYFNGALEPGQIQANVKLAVGTVMAAQNSKTRDTSETMQRRGNMINNAVNTRDNNSIIRFLDTVFTRKKDKDHILGVIAKNDWK